MATVTGPETSMARVREAVKQLRKDFKVPDNKVMSSKKSAKPYERKAHAANVLASVQGISLTFVVSKKSELAPGSFQSGKKDYFDFVSEKAYISALWAAKSFGARSARIRFGHVIGMDQAKTKKHIRDQTVNNPKVPTYLEKELSWVSADKYLESQAADLYASFLKDAFWPDEFGNIHPQHLFRVWHQIRKGDHGCVSPLGVFAMPHYGVLTRQPWFRCNCPSGH